MATQEGGQQDGGGGAAGEQDYGETKFRYPGIKAMPFIIGNETFEKLGTIGTSSNLLVYLTSVFHMRSLAATKLVNTFTGTTNFAPLLGAFLSDTFYGRYSTLAVASLSSLTGMLVLTLTAAIPRLHPPRCGGGEGCEGATPPQLAFLMLGFALLVVGAGGIRPCNLAFGADQFDPRTAAGKRAVTSFFNWYYFTFTFAMVASLTFIVYVQSSVSWSLGLAIPTALMALSCLFFFLGTPVYVRVMPEGSPLTSAAQVVVAAVKKRDLRLPDQPELSLFNHLRPGSVNCRLPHTSQFRFLDKGAIRTPEDKFNADGSAAAPWRLTNIQQSEEVKCLIRVLPIWVACMIYNISNVQQQTFVVFQALQSDRRLGGGSFRIPAASYIAFAMLSLTIWIPIYDRLLVPALRRVTGKEAGITVLQKMGVGMVLGVLTMVVSGLVEQRRRSVALTAPVLGVDQKGHAVSSLSALWLVPQLCLSGVSEAFAVVGQVEFYYRQFPENMRSIGAAFLFCGFAGSSYASNLLVSAVHHLSAGAGTGGDSNWLAEDLNRGKLDWFYYLIGALEVLNLGYFVMCARWYLYKGGNEDSSKKPSGGAVMV